MAVLCIGEMLIDFIGEGVGTIDTVKSFKKEAGGCVANVACVTQKLGHKSYLLMMDLLHYQQDFIQVITM